MTDPLPFSQASENNAEPILQQLRVLLTSPGAILEIGTGTGQHAEHFAGQLPHLRWRPTDHPDALWACRRRLERASLPNVDPPRALDVGQHPWDVPRFDHAYSANTAHIMAWEEVQAMFAGVSEGLGPQGYFCLYGPFNDGGQFTSASNRRFDEQLRARAAHMGLRGIQDLDSLARRQGMCLYQDQPMPANNRLLVFTSAVR